MKTILGAVIMIMSIVLTTSFVANTNRGTVSLPSPYAFCRKPTSSYLAQTSSSTSLKAATFDPAAAIGQLMGGLVGSPAVLLVPIGAAFLVASAIAFFILSYANPADPDED